MRTVQIEKRRLLVEGFFLRHSNQQTIKSNLENLADICGTVDREAILNISDMITMHSSGCVDLVDHFDSHRLLIYSWAQCLSHNIRLCQPEQVIMIDSLLQLLLDLDTFTPPAWSGVSFQ